MLRRLVDVRDPEVRGLLWSFVYFFALMCAYAVLKPLRDEMAITGGVRKLPWLFSATFVGTLLAIPIFGALVARVPRRTLLPWLYRFLWLNLALFLLLMTLEVSPPLVARVFFVWTSVINLFLTSVFWSFMADTFRSEQGKRLFGFIAAGGTIGMLSGPLLSSLLVRLVGTGVVLIVSILLLELAARCVPALVRWADAHATSSARVEAMERPVGGNVFAAFVQVARSPYLLALCAQTLLYAVTSTVLYTHYLSTLADTVTDSQRRTELFGYVETGVNALTLGLQALVTGAVMKRIGLAAALAVVPALTLGGFLWMGVALGAAVVVAVFALRRALHYAFERPAREVLFTSVEREAKYKAKPFIDTVVYRGGDAVGGWVLAGFSGLGLTTSGAALAALPAAAAWLGVNLFLARRQEAQGQATAEAQQWPA